ncbi:SGNH hydrolase-type esterase domain containing protein [uncultured Caudovirales phage]|uniref:SGNH hydrolase-type esterase domain containing protein n=1 Tax=uncultured Caudovirales phage TaxID=2100421 RepID=A0A6J5QU08_9CAUD|nr:SGNH hydrolase-type esterase domain containing protein [uncultured Caudovirales phage]
MTTTTAPLIGSNIQTLQPTSRTAEIATFGDSLAQKINGVRSATLTSYSSTTGLATITSTGHGLTQGILQDFVIQGAPGFTAYDSPIVTVIDANTLTMVLPTGQGTIPTGAASLTARQSYAADHPHAWCSAATRPNVTANFGVGSETTAQMLLRVDQAARCPQEVILVQAGTNDVGASVSYDTTASRIIDMCNTILAAGKTIILSPPAPRASTTVAIALIGLKLARALQEYAGTQSNVYFLDSYGAIADPASLVGLARSGYMDSSSHYTQRGARAVGVLLQTIYTKIFGGMSSNATVSGLDGFNATNNPLADNIFANPNFLTATGGNVGSGTITGAIAAGVTLRLTGNGTFILSGLCSVPAASGGIGNCQQFKATPAANGDVMRLTTEQVASSVGLRMTAGEWRTAGWRVKTSGISAGNPVLSCLEFRLVIVSTGGTTTIVRDLSFGTRPTSSTEAEQVDYDQILQTPPFQVPVGVTSCYLNLELQFLAAGTEITLEVSQPTLTKTSLRP